jgi:hypothetical protein
MMHGEAAPVLRLAKRFQLPYFPPIKNRVAP